MTAQKIKTFYLAVGTTVLAGSVTLRKTVNQGN